MSKRRTATALSRAVDQLVAQLLEQAEQQAAKEQRLAQVPGKRRHRTGSVHSGCCGFLSNGAVVRPDPSQFGVRMDRWG